MLNATVPSKPMLNATVPSKPMLNAPLFMTPGNCLVFVLIRSPLPVFFHHVLLFLSFLSPNRMFYEMPRRNAVTWNVILRSMHVLEEGMQIHGVVVKWGLREDNVISSSLIDMYVKCGELENGSQVFYQLVSKDLVSWTCIVSGYAMRGKTWDARRLFDQMPERNVTSWNAMLAGYTRFFKWYEALDFVGLMLDTVKDLDHVTLC
ncbi:unnamed protein product [Vicia faba]|uniref:Pentatricopeptide repeat-containing protein n=1 Tax=Vicia faba TaxID=3906 RepID=A0AAV0ZKM8_VICFA|nr:unnamed protein product [Vicia faba]